MKTNGLRNKKTAMARAAWRTWYRIFWRQCYQGDFNSDYWDGRAVSEAIFRWHRAAKGRK